MLCVVARGRFNPLSLSFEVAQRPDSVAHWKPVTQDVERATATLKMIGDE